MVSTSNYAIKPTPEQALRTIRTLAPARLIAALAVYGGLMRGDVEVLVMIAFFFIGALLGNTFALDRFPDWPISLADALATLLATFLGAWFAFRFQSRHEQSEKRASELSILNHTIFQVISIHNQFLAIQRQFIDPCKEEPGAYLKMKPMTTMLPASTFEYSRLGFLFRSSNPNVLGTLSQLELEVVTTLDVIRQRSELHVEKVQVVVEQLEKEKGPLLSEREIVTALGRRNSELMKSLSEHMVQGVADVLKSTNEHVTKLFNIAKELFPGEKSIRMDNPKNHSTGKDG